MAMSIFGTDSFRVIEVNVGIICASSSILLAFIDRHCPESIKASAAQFFSSIISRSHTSGDNSKASSKKNAQELELKGRSQRGFAPLDDGDAVADVGAKSAVEARSNQQV